MIEPRSRMFAVERDDYGVPTRFVQSLPDVIDRHMMTSARMFRPSSLQRDFRAECGLEVSRQAVYSALMALVRRDRVRRDGRGLYRHVAHG